MSATKQKKQAFDAVGILEHHHRAITACPTWKRVAQPLSSWS